MSSEVNSLPLNGQWYFAADREDKGIEEKWFLRFPENGEQVSLPGSMAESGKGNDVSLDTPWTGRIRDTSFFTDERYEEYRQPGKIKLPFWLTPVKHYMGVAWYQRDFEIPADWTGKTAHLALERTHWTVQVWVDAAEVGFGESLSTSHKFMLADLQPGHHRLTLRVDNRMYVDVGEDAHSISDHSQTNWNGVIGEVCISATNTVYIDNLQIYPSSDGAEVRVITLLRNSGNAGVDAKLTLAVHDVQSGAKVSEEVDNAVHAAPGETATEAKIIMTEKPQFWDEFNPALYELRAGITANEESTRAVERFGFRQFEARGTRFFLNNRPTYLRGTLECCVFPLTGYPPMEKESWTRIMRILKSHGLNHMRFHSWCPPKAAFDAADEAGIIFSVECASWATLGFDEKYEQWLYREADRILREYGNHPSFCMMLYGNEPYGFRAADFLAQFVNHYKELDSRRLFSSGTAWPLIPENEFQVWANPRIQYWDQNLDSRINASPPETVSNYENYIAQYEAPVISHEIGQWCVYPNFEEIPKYIGILKPGSLEIFQDFLEKSGMSDLAHAFLMASGRLQVMCYKEEIESALRTKGMGGFQLLDLHDFPGQGTALVGILDPFWDSKPYVNAEEFRKFCAPIVPLVEMEKRVFTSAESLNANLLIAQFGADTLPVGNIEWALSSDGSTVYSGQIATNPIASGQLIEAGAISQDFADEQAARKLVLDVKLPGGAGQNTWDIWVYPEKLNVSTPANILITGVLDDSARERLRAGGKVLLMPDVKHIKGDERGQVPPGFSSIFWNTAWTQGQKPHTLGILCDPQHEALAHFPTEYHSNWQWWYIIHRSRSMIMNPLPKTLRPIIQVIDDWFTARKLGLVFECEMDGGKLLVCSVDLKDAGKDDPVGRQLLFSLLKYMESQAFAPEIPVTSHKLEAVIGDSPVEV